MRPFFIAAATPTLIGDAKNATACARESGDCGEALTFEADCCFSYSKTNKFECIVVPYIMPVPVKVQRLNAIRYS
jgi:hypothetical protein